MKTINAEDSTLYVPRHVSDFFNKAPSSDISLNAFEEGTSFQIYKELAAVTSEPPIIGNLPEQPHTTSASFGSPPRSVHDAIDDDYAGKLAVKQRNASPRELPKIQLTRKSSQSNRKYLYYPILTNFLLLTRSTFLIFLYFMKLKITVKSLQYE